MGDPGINNLTKSILESSPKIENSMSVLTDKIKNSFLLSFQSIATNVTGSFEQINVITTQQAAIFQESANSNIIQCANVTIALSTLLGVMSEIGACGDIFAFFTPLLTFQEILAGVLANSTALLFTVLLTSGVENVFAGFGTTETIQENLDNILQTLQLITEEYNKPDISNYVSNASGALSILSTDWDKVKNNIDLAITSGYVFATDLFDKIKNGIPVVIEGLKTFVKHIGSVAKAFYTANWHGLLLIGAFAVLGTGLAALAQNWDKMSSLGQTCTILATLASAALAAAIAVALFHTSWSIGIAAAAITAGASAVLGSILWSGTAEIPAPAIPMPTDGNFFASGGFPSMGQMFIAREAGPELVGTIGSRSAVVNNDQIVESVSAGVYRAVKAAMGQNGGGVIQLILDGTKVAEVVSDNVNAITRRTGRCPILV